MCQPRIEVPSSKLKHMPYRAPAYHLGARLFFQAKTKKYKPTPPSAVSASQPPPLLLSVIAPPVARTGKITAGQTTGSACQAVRPAPRHDRQNGLNVRLRSEERVMNMAVTPLMANTRLVAVSGRATPNAPSAWFSPRP